MSTVTEVLTAAHCGMRTLAISLITNMGAGVDNNRVDGQEVDEVAARSAREFRTYLKRDRDAYGPELGEGVRTMRNLKRFAAVGLSLAMALMTGCGASEKPAAEKDASAKKKVALVCDVAGTQVFILDMIDGLKASAENTGLRL